MPGKGLHIRVASWDDELFMFNLWNDPVARNMMKTKKKVSLTEHKKWFSDKMEKQDEPTFITLEGEKDIDEKKVGVVRFINQGKSLYDVSIIVSPNYRNRGLGTDVLKLSVLEMKKKFPDSLLFAMYKKANVSVRKVFLNSKFFECSPNFECKKIDEFNPETELFCIHRDINS
mgnify:CR=1 FL=1